MSNLEQPVLTSDARSETARLSRWVWPGIALAIILVFLYYRILGGLVNQWWSDPNYSHGFLVPFFSAFLIWKDRKKLAAIEARPSASGLLIVIGGAGILIFGVLGAELFTSRTSLLFILAGLVIYFQGWKYFRAVVFAWLFLFLMVPPPDLIMNMVTIPLQFLASDLATWFLRLFGVPVLQNGNVLQLSDMSLEVIEACSGIRSLISLGTLAIIYGFLLEESYVLRVVLAFAAVPIAVLANGLRIMGTGITGLYWDPDKAQGFFHEFSGWVIFILSLIALFILHKILRGLYGIYKRSKT
ncbi:MAG: exosortase/archaeosortase family protein [Terriglobia bacterium]